MARIIGLERELAKLKDLVGPDLDAQVGAALFVAGNEVQVEAQISITEGAVSGRYHEPSKPGEPPNNDLGDLANSIATIQTDKLKVEVEATAPHAVHLEFGTSKMEQRPYLEPAAARMAPRIAEHVRKAVHRAERAANRKP